METLAGVSAWVSGVGFLQGKGRQFAIPRHPRKDEKKARGNLRENGLFQTKVKQVRF
jgi:hypothetical protein